MIQEVKFAIAVISAMMMFRMFLLIVLHGLLLSLIGLWIAIVSGVFGYYMGIDFKVGSVIVIGLTWVMFELLTIEGKYL